MLSAQDKALITAHPAGMVATVNSDGTPSVSPKATFVILDDSTLAFGNIRSPGTLSNLRERPSFGVKLRGQVVQVSIDLHAWGDRTVNF